MCCRKLGMGGERESEREREFSIHLLNIFTAHKQKLSEKILFSSSFFSSFLWFSDNCAWMFAYSADNSDPDDWKSSLSLTLSPRHGKFIEYRLCRLWKIWIDVFWVFSLGLFSEWFNTFFFLCRLSERLQQFLTFPLKITVRIDKQRMNVWHWREGFRRHTCDVASSVQFRAFRVLPTLYNPWTYATFVREILRPLDMSCETYKKLVVWMLKCLNYLEIYWKGFRRWIFTSLLLRVKRESIDMMMFTRTIWFLKKCC